MSLEGTNIAIANVDKLLSLIEKAQMQLLQAADTLDTVIVEATAVGGQIGQTVPPHIQADIDKITALVESDDASSLSSLDDLISNMPIRSVKSLSPSERRDQRAAAPDVTPNTATGPQSQIAARESFNWRNYEKEDVEYDGRALSWDKLNESEAFRHPGEEPIINVGVREEPIDAFQYRQKIRETINNDSNEADDDSAPADRLNESFNWRGMAGVVGSIDGMPSFESIARGDLKAPVSQQQPL